MSNGRYCYPGTDVLINKYNIKDKQMLDEFEVQKVSVKLLGLSYDPTRVQPTCDAVHLKELNEYLFSDLYDWAGQFRMEDFYKSEKALSGASVQYCLHNHIERKLDELFSEYTPEVWQDEERYVSNSVDFLTRLWVIHPFREGNTRTCITFMWQYLKEQGIELNVDLLRRNPHYVRDALVMSSYDIPIYLTRILEDALSDRGLAIVNDVLSDANEKYVIAKEEYKLLKEKYLAKEAHRAFDEKEQPDDK